MILPPGEIYASIDIEADGKIPGVSSMINFGAVFYTHKGEEIAFYHANLAPLPPPAAPDPETLQWWEKQFKLNPKLKEELSTNVKDPQEVMDDFVDFVESLGRRHKVPITAMAYPAGFDFTWMYWYMMYFVGRSPFSFSCLDIKSYAMAKMGCNYRAAVKRNMPKSWFGKGDRHTHVGLDDARGQGRLFFNMN
jgi:hypothetical protein